MATILIFAGEYVFVQDGPVDQPKMAILEDVMVEEAVTVSVSIGQVVTPPPVVEEPAVQFHKGYQMFPWETRS